MRNLAATVSAFLLALTVVLTISFRATMSADTSTPAAADIFHKPIRLRAADAFIDTGEAWGHSGPCLADVDGDGKLDLVVGDFSGQFRFYRNIGTNAEPRYAPCAYLMAGGEVAKVPIY